MAVALADYRLYEHCYQEGGACGTKEIACENGSVIDIIRSVVGYSEYWALDGSRTNCTAMNDTCYGEVTDPVELCSRSSRCELETCSNFTRQRLSCLVLEVTNVLQINYTCVGKRVRRTNYECRTNEESHCMSVYLSDCLSVCLYVCP